MGRLEPMSQETNKQMKRTFILVLGLSLTMISQAISIAEWKNYFAENIATIDPVEGVYNVAIQHEGHSPGYSTGVTAISANVAIVKEGSIYKMFVNDGGYFRNGAGEWYSMEQIGETNAFTFYVKNGDRHVASVRTYIQDSFQFRVTVTQTFYSAVSTVTYDFIKEYPTRSMYEEQLNATRQKQWTGTGWALNGGYIVTNFHCVDGAKTIKVKGIQGDFTTEYSALVVATDKVNDLAVIHIQDGKFTDSIEIPYCIETKQCDVGENIWTLGYPMMSIMGDEIKFTDGKISSKTGYMGDLSTYQISAPIQPGNSGGPMFNELGNIVGITSSGLNKQVADNVNYAIKSSYLINLIESALSTEIIPKGKLENLSLTEYIKRNRNFVYQLYFSNSTEDSIDRVVSEEENENQQTHSSISKLSEYKVIKPSIKFYWERVVSIPTITITDEYTILDINICWLENGKFFANANSDASLVDVKTGISYKLLKVENVQMSPSKSYYSRQIGYRMYFEKLPDSTNKIQLHNGGIFGGGAWKYKLDIKSIYW